MVDSPLARAILRTLAERWPEEADLQRVAIDDRTSDRIVVTVWTATPGTVIGCGGRTVAVLKERLRAVVPDRYVELRVHAGEPPGESGGPVEEDAPTEAARQGRDLVPDLIGMSVGDAREKAHASGFPLATDDPDGLPMSYYLTHGQWTVVGQRPAPGVLALLHSSIVVDLEDRGGGGEARDREPRVPGPTRGVLPLERAAVLEDIE